MTRSARIIERKAEDPFVFFAGGPPGANPRTAMSFSVEIDRLDNYLFQIAGPTSLQVLEKAMGESLRDVIFLHFRERRINGIKTEVARIGMTGNLAYELHGPVEEGPTNEAVYKAGLELGIEPRLGNLSRQPRRGWIFRKILGRSFPPSRRRCGHR
jgi:vanillate/3-O-methylgallate O-demethylase